MDPGLSSVATELCADGKQGRCVSLAIKWARIIFHSRNNLKEVVSRIVEMEMEANEECAGTNKIAEGVLDVTFRTSRP